MKTFRIFGLEIKFSFSVEQVKTITVPIPDWADDTHVRDPDDLDLDKLVLVPKMDKPEVWYYKGSKLFRISLPPCRKAKSVSLTPLYNKDRTAHSENRKIVIDLFY